MVVNNKNQADIGSNLANQGSHWWPGSVANHIPSRNPDAAVYLSPTALGGGNIRYKYTSGKYVSDEDREEGFTGSFMINTEASAQTIAWAREAAETDGVVVTGNFAYGYGSGIMTNGNIIIGTDWQDVEVQKNWYDIDMTQITDPEKLPDQLIVYLTRMNKDGTYELVDLATRADAVQVLNQENNWYHKWENLGANATWGVAEASVDGWKLISVETGSSNAPQSYTFMPTDLNKAVTLDKLSDYGHLVKILQLSESSDQQVYGYITAVRAGDFIAPAIDGDKNAAAIQAESTIYYQWIPAGDNMWKPVPLDSFIESPSSKIYLSAPEGTKANDQEALKTYGVVNQVLKNDDAITGYITAVSPGDIILTNGIASSVPDTTYCKWRVEPDGTLISEGAITAEDVQKLLEDGIGEPTTDVIQPIPEPEEGEEPLTIPFEDLRKYGKIDQVLTQETVSGEKTITGFVTVVTKGEIIQDTNGSYTTADETIFRVWEYNEDGLLVVQDIGTPAENVGTPANVYNALPEDKAEIPAGAVEQYGKIFGAITEPDQRPEDAKDDWVQTYQTLGWYTVVNKGDVILNTDGTYTVKAGDSFAEWRFKDQDSQDILILNGELGGTPDAPKGKVWAVPLPGVPISFDDLSKYGTLCNIVKNNDGTAKYITVVEAGTIVVDGNKETTAEKTTYYSWTFKDGKLARDVSTTTSSGIILKNAATLEGDVGKLSFSKQAFGFDDGKEFTFEVTLTLQDLTDKSSGEDIRQYTIPTYAIKDKNGEDIQKDQPFSDTTGAGTYNRTFTLKNGDTVTISGLIKGDTYSIKEIPKESDSYDTYINNVKSDDREKTGTIENTGEETTSMSFEFTNINKTDLIVNKVWSGDTATDRPEKITVYLKRDGNKVVEEGISPVTITPDELGNWTYTFKDLPMYKQVTSVDSEDPEKIEYTYAPIIYTVEEDKVDGYTTVYSDPTKDENNHDTITVTNTKTPPPQPQAGSLTIRKTVDGTEADLNQAFRFHLSFSDLTSLDGVTVSGAGTAERDTMQPNTSYFVTLSNGQEITFSNLPAGTRYEITEEDTDYTVTSSLKNAQGIITTGTKTLSGIITASGIDEVQFNNHKGDIQPGNLTISKVVSGNRSSTQRDFTFTVTLRDANGNLLAGTYPYTGSHEGNVENGTATFPLRHGQSITISGLPAGTAYEVSEEAGDYSPTVSNGSGTITAGTTITAAFDNYRNGGGGGGGGRRPTPDTEIDEPPVPQVYYPGEEPDPNEPDSPDEITIIDEDVPQTYIKTWDPENEEYVYLPEEPTPLAPMTPTPTPLTRLDTTPKTDDPNHPWFWLGLCFASILGIGLLKPRKKHDEK